MTENQRTSISLSDLEQILFKFGFTTIQGPPSHRSYIGPNKTRFTLPAKSTINPVYLSLIRNMLSKLNGIDIKEFDSLIEDHSLILEKVVKQGSEGKPNTPIYFEVNDPILRERLTKLVNTPFDTIIREAGVILEDRVRHTANLTDENLYGVNLIDAALGVGKAKIVMSDNPGEQEGARLLFRGTIQFIRNPAMHKIIDYSEKEVRIYLRVIDSLLQLLSEVKKT